MILDPLVSVVIPTYKRPGYLAAALESALSQTYSQLQVIVSDNASGDETPLVVAGFADERILFLESIENIGGIRNFNKCIDHAEGKYLMVLSDDDLISSNYIRCMVDLMETNLSILAYGSTCVIDSQGEVLSSVNPDKRCFLEGTEFLKMWCSRKAPIVTPFCFFAVNAQVKQLGGVPHFPSGDNVDNALMAALALQGSVSLTDECTYFYRKHTGNDSGGISWSLRAQCLKAFLKYMNQPSLEKHWKSLPLQEEESLKESMRHVLVESYLNRIFYGHHEKMGFVKTLMAVFHVPIKKTNYEMIRHYTRHQFYLNKERIKTATAKMRQKFS